MSISSWTGMGWLPVKQAMQFRFSGCPHGSQQAFFTEIPEGVGPHEFGDLVDFPA